MTDLEIETQLMNLIIIEMVGKCSAFYTPYPSFGLWLYHFDFSYTQVKEFLLKVYQTNVCQ
jgi:hypothetical protein